ncbi:hypothetical protein D3C75_1090330 [compost metagenome]
MPGALQCQIETVVEPAGLLAIQLRQRDVHATAQPVQPGTGFKRQALVIDVEFQGIFNAADVADANHQKRLVEAVVIEVLVDAPALRQLETPRKTPLGMEQPRLVDTPLTQFGVHP